MRAHAPGDPRRPGTGADDRVEAPHAEPASARVPEERSWRLAALGQIRVERVSGGRAERDGAFLPPLAQHGHRPADAVDVIEVEARQFGHPHAGCVQQLQNRPAVEPAQFNRRFVIGVRFRDCSADPGR